VAFAVELLAHAGAFLENTAEGSRIRDMRRHALISRGNGFLKGDHFQEIGFDEAWG
jgi:hypothetical protein